MHFTVTFFVQEWQGEDVQKNHHYRDIICHCVIVILWRYHDATNWKQMPGTGGLWRHHHGRVLLDVTSLQSQIRLSLAHSRGGGGGGGERQSDKVFLTATVHTRIKFRLFQSRDSTWMNIWHVCLGLSKRTRKLCLLDPCSSKKGRTKKSL